MSSIRRRCLFGWDVKTSRPSNNSWGSGSFCWRLEANSRLNQRNCRPRSVPPALLEREEYVARLIEERRGTWEAPEPDDSYSSTIQTRGEETWLAWQTFAQTKVQQQQKLAYIEEVVRVGLIEVPEARRSSPPMHPTHWNGERPQRSTPLQHRSLMLARLHEIFRSPRPPHRLGD